MQIYKFSCNKNVIIQVFHSDIVRITKTQVVWRPRLIITVHLEASTHFTKIYIFR